jgi:hypothetical protein
MAVNADETRAPLLTLSRFAREGTYRTIYPIRRRAAQPIIPNIPTISIVTALGSGTHEPSRRSVSQSADRPENRRARGLEIASAELPPASALNEIVASVNAPCCFVSRVLGESNDTDANSDRQGRRDDRRQYRVFPARPS